MPCSSRRLGLAAEISLDPGKRRDAENPKIRILGLSFIRLKILTAIKIYIKRGSIRGSEDNCTWIDADLRGCARSGLLIPSA
jgi:hypothetical protein